MQHGTVESWLKMDVISANQLIVICIEEFNERYNLLI